MNSMEDIENIKYVSKKFFFPGYLGFSSYYFPILEIHKSEKCIKGPDKPFNKEIHLTLLTKCCSNLLPFIFCSVSIAV